MEVHKKYVVTTPSGTKHREQGWYDSEAEFRRVKDLQAKRGVSIREVTPQKRTNIYDPFNLF